MMIGHNIKQDILADQVRQVYRPLIFVIIGNTIGSAAVVLGLWEHLSRSLLLGWFVAMSVVSLFRVSVYHHFRRYFHPGFANRYGRYYTIGSGLYGLLWGIAGILLFPENNNLLQFYLFIVLVGLVFGGVITKIPWLPSIHAFLPVTLVPICLRLFFQGEILTTSLGTGGLALILVLYVYAVYANKALIETLRLRYENIDLVDQLRTQKEEAEHANIAKSRFLAAASHDLRQPLHALTLFASALKEAVQSEKALKLVGQVDTSVTALKSLFDALLDISRLDAGTMNVEKSHFSLQCLLDKLANDYIPQAAEKGLHIHWPKCDLIIHSDINLYEQILRNFISNAIRYTSAGKIDIHCALKDHQAVVEVMDSGMGIPKEKQHVIFEEFQQLNNPERDRSKGLGLGLAIVKRIADLLGHRIAVSSAHGKGSTFSVTAEQGDHKRLMPKSVTHRQAPVHESDSILIVVIDDELSVREGMHTLLETWGYGVITAADQQEAAAKLQQQHQVPDAIIADYRLRGNQTGIETIAAMHAQYGRQIPALIVTGDIAAEPLREVSLSGFQVLHKPVAPAKLRTFLNNVTLHKHRRKIN